MMWTMIPGSADGGRPVTHEPLTSLTASSNAIAPSPRSRSSQPNASR